MAHATRSSGRNITWSTGQRAKEGLGDRTDSEGKNVTGEDGATATEKAKRAKEIKTTIVINAAYGVR